MAEMSTWPQIRSTQTTGVPWGAGGDTAKYIGGVFINLVYLNPGASSCVYMLLPCTDRLGGRVVGVGGAGDRQPVGGALG